MNDKADICRSADAGLHDMMEIGLSAVKRTCSFYIIYRKKHVPVSYTHLRVCLSIFYHTRHPWMVFWTCTVTCRQFSNLTFAPRKTCHLCGSNLALHCYQCHNNWEYTRPLRKMQVFFSLFLIFFCTCFCTIFCYPVWYNLPIFLLPAAGRSRLNEFLLY